MPTPEYCLLGFNWWPLCMTKAEWSGWFQAIFSVTAIFAAIWIARAGERLRRVEAIDAAEVAAVLLAADLREFIAAVKRAEVAFREAGEPDGNWVHFVDAANAIARLDELPADQILRVTSASPDVAGDVARLAEVIFRLRASINSLEWVQHGLNPTQLTLKRTVLANLQDLSRDALHCVHRLSVFSTMRAAARQGAHKEEARWNAASLPQKIRILCGHG